MKITAANCADFNMTPAELAEWEAKRYEFWLNEMTEEEREEARAWEHDQEQWEAEEEERALIDVRDAVSADHMLRVSPRFSPELELEGYFVRITVQAPERRVLELYCPLAQGGLFTVHGVQVLPPFEFSLHRYEFRLNDRRPYEYARRKLSKLRR